MAHETLTCGEMNAGPFEAMCMLAERAKNGSDTPFAPAQNLPYHSVEFMSMTEVTNAVNDILYVMKKAGLMEADKT